MTSSTANDSKAKYQKEYFRLTIIYTDGEFSSRVFKNRASAEKYAAKQKKSPVVKRTKVEAFIKNRYEWRKVRADRLKKAGILK